MALSEELGPPVASRYETEQISTFGYCRLCGEQKSVTELWDIKSNQDFYENFDEKLEYLNVYLDFNCNLPNYICQPCYDDLNHAYNFFKRVDSAQVSLDLVFDELPSQSGHNTPNYDSDGSPGTSNYYPGRKERLQKIARQYHEEISGLLKQKGGKFGKSYMEIFSDCFFNSISDSRYNLDDRDASSSVSSPYMSSNDESDNTNSDNEMFEDDQPEDIDEMQRNIDEIHDDESGIDIDNELYYAVDFNAENDENQMNNCQFNENNVYEIDLCNAGHDIEILIADYDARRAQNDMNVEIQANNGNFVDDNEMNGINEATHNMRDSEVSTSEIDIHPQQNDVNAESQFHQLNNENEVIDNEMIELDEGAGSKRVIEVTTSDINDDFEHNDINSENEIGHVNGNEITNNDVNDSADLTSPSTVDTDIYNDCENIPEEPNKEYQEKSVLNSIDENQLKNIGNCLKNNRSSIGEENVPHNGQDVYYYVEGNAYHYGENENEVQVDINDNTQRVDEMSDETEIDDEYEGTSENETTHYEDCEISDLTELDSSNTNPFEIVVNSSHFTDIFENMAAKHGNGGH